MIRRTSIIGAPAVALALMLFGRAFGPASMVTAAKSADILEPIATILVYHRFGPDVRDAMTVRTSTFDWQLRYLKEHGRAVVPLRDVVTYLRGAGPAPPPHAVVITADDGHTTVFSDMAPLIRKYGTKATLFIYPSAISNASYAMTWSQLETLRDSGFFDIQSHTFWHPNFKVEKRQLEAAAYREFASTQLCKARAVLRDRLQIDANLLAWPFGIHDVELEELARGCGYDAALTLERRAVSAGDRLMALPRFLVTDAATGERFAAMVR